MIWAKGPMVTIEPCAGGPMVTIEPCSVARAGYRKKTALKKARVWAMFLRWGRTSLERARIKSARDLEEWRRTASLAETPQQFGHQGSHQRHSAQGSIVLAMLPVQRCRKLSRLLAIGLPSGEQPRHVAGVLVEGGKNLAQVGLFVTDHRQVDDKVHRNDDVEYPDAARSKGEAGGHDQRSEIKRIARVVIGAGGGEFFIFPDVSGGEGAKGNARECDECAESDRDPRGAGDPEVEDGEGESQGDTNAARDQ